MAQVLTVVIQPLNYDHKFPWHGTAGGGDDFIGQSRVTQLIKRNAGLAWGAAPRVRPVPAWARGGAALAPSSAGSSGSAGPAASHTG